MLTAQQLHAVHEELEQVQGLWLKNRKASPTGKTYLVSHQLLGYLLVPFQKTLTDIVKTAVASSKGPPTSKIAAPSKTTLHKVMADVQQATAKVIREQNKQKPTSKQNHNHLARERDPKTGRFKPTKK